MEHWQNHMHRQLHRHVQDWIKAGRPEGGPHGRAPEAEGLPAEATGAPKGERAKVA